MRLLPRVVKIEKLAVRAPAGIVMLGGTLVRTRLLLDSTITAPPVGALAVSVTVPVDVCPPVTVDGFSVKDCSAAAAGGFTVMFADLVTPA